MNPLFGQAVPMGNDSLLNITPGLGTANTTKASTERMITSAQPKRRFKLRSFRRGGTPSSMQQRTAPGSAGQYLSTTRYPLAQELAFTDSASRDTLALFDDAIVQESSRSSSAQSHERSQAKWQQLRHKASKHKHSGLEIEDREV
jgi:hypothetical protein